MEYAHREDHQPYSTPVVEETICAYCGASITQRAEGRRRIFCDSTCRSGSYRKAKPSKAIRAGKRQTKRR